MRLILNIINYTNYLHDFRFIWKVPFQWVGKDVNGLKLPSVMRDHAVYYDAIAV